MTSDEVARFISDPITVEGNDTAVELGRLMKKTSETVTDIMVRISSLHALEDRAELPRDVILTEKEAEELQDLVWKLKTGRVRALQLLQKRGGR